MTHDSLDDVLHLFSQEAGGLVRVPGAGDVRRLVLRRQRTRLVGAVAVAVLALGGAFGVYLTGATKAPAFAPASPSAPSSVPSPAPSPTTVSASPTGTPAPTPDLNMAAPTSVTLTALGGHYQGEVSVTVRNLGLVPYQQTVLLATLPAGVHMAGTSIGPCVFNSQPDSLTCGADPVPAGGTLTYVITLTADYAPQAQDLTLSGFRLRFDADGYGDPTPSDNSAAIELVLKATG